MSPHRVTPDEIQAIQEMATSPDYRHVPTGTPDRPRRWLGAPSSDILPRPMSIEIVRGQVPRSVIERAAAERFGDMVKAVVDIRRRIMAIGGDLHADEETLLLDDGSQQADLWGINLYLATPDDDWLEYDSMINVRPAQGNRSRGVENPILRQQIRAVVDQLVERS